MYHNTQVMAAEPKVESVRRRKTFTQSETQPNATCPMTCVPFKRQRSRVALAGVMERVAAKAECLLDATLLE